MAHEGGKDKSHSHSTKHGQSHPSVSVKPADVVVVPSDKLVFSLSPEGGHEGKAKAHLVVHNPTNASIIFKFKSNATGSTTVGVHPCSGHVHPGEHADVNVILDYDSEEKAKDLKLLVVTARAPEGEYDLKTVWEDIEADDLKTTKVKCMISKENASQQKSCFLSKGQAASPSPSSGSKPHPASSHKEKEATKPSPRQDSGPASAPAPASQHHSSQHEEGHMSQQHDPLPKASMFTGLQPHHQQQQSSRSRPMDEGNRQGTLQMNQQDNSAHQGRKPTSYFVDVSSVAASGSNSPGASTSRFFGMDNKTMMQAVLLIAAGAAATKFFFE